MELTQICVKQLSQLLSRTHYSTRTHLYTQSKRDACTHVLYIFQPVLPPGLKVNNTNQHVAI